MPTKIEWAEETWNPITGCTPISPGCLNCYAQRMSYRLAGRAGYPEVDPFLPGVLHPDKLDRPERWRKPRMIFVCSMGDLFHERVDGQHINLVWMRMFNNPRHIYMVLTKRPERLKEWTEMKASATAWPIEDIWPPWIWLGVTAENQEMADKRIPILLSIPARFRFVSIEPMLGFVELDEFMWGPSRYEDTPGGQRWRKSDQTLHWVIVGGETGPGARMMKADWVRDVRDRCRENDIPFFFKHWGTNETSKAFESLNGERKIDGREWKQVPEMPRSPFAKDNPHSHGGGRVRK